MKKDNFFFIAYSCIYTSKYNFIRLVQSKMSNPLVQTEWCFNNILLLIISVAVD